MSESLVSQTAIAFSTAVESAYGTNPVTASLFTSMVTKVRTFPVPDGEKTDDRGVVGRGNAMYPQFQRSGFRVPTAFDITDTVQVGTLAPLVRRYMGKTGTTPTTVEASVAFLHKFYELDPDVGGLQLPSSSFVYSNNEYDHLLTGGCGSTFAVQQQGTTDPQFTLGMVMSGNAKRISVDYPSFGSLPAYVTDPYMYGPDSGAVYTDDASATVNLTTPSHKVRDLQFSANNHLVLDDTRMGMPAINASDPRDGWYRDFLHFGDREVSGNFTTGMDSTYALMTAAQRNLSYTNFTWTMKGDPIPSTASNNRYQFAIVIPKFTLRTPGTGEASNKMTKSFVMFPLVNGTHYGLYHLELQNGVSSAIQ